MSTGVSLTLGVVLLLLNAFFVAVEFALVASRVHALEDRAEGGGRAARAALHGARELSVMLAGAQLGITLSTLGLGALAEPALEQLLHPVFSALGLPDRTAYAVSLVVGVAVVVLLHMVIGEMAPKSWAIAHPETSAVWLSLPFRGFTRAVGPVLTLLNDLSNALVRLIGVTPRGENSSQVGPADLQMLIAQSRETRRLTEGEYQRLRGALQLEQLRLGDRAKSIVSAVTIDAAADSRAVERISREHGRSRLIVMDDGLPIGIVHVRDALRAGVHDRHDVPVRELLRAVPRFPRALPLIDALATMRAQQAQLAFVAGEDGAVVAFIAMEDLIEEVLGHFEDETDRRATRHT